MRREVPMLIFAVPMNDMDTIDIAQRIARRGLEQIGRIQPFAVVEARRSLAGRAPYEDRTALVISLHTTDQAPMMEALRALVSACDAVAASFVCGGWTIRRDLTAPERTEAHRHVQAGSSIAGMPFSGEGIIVTREDATGILRIETAPIDRTDGALTLGEFESDESSHAVLVGAVVGMFKRKETLPS